MSILINMEMPNNCRACRLKMNCDDCEGRECVCVPLHQQIGYLDDLLTDKRRDDCPLILVPPHGRLGDLDALHKLFLEKAKEYKSAGGAMVAMAALCIANAPIIIEAEEGE